MNRAILLGALVLVAFTLVACLFKDKRTPRKMSEGVSGTRNVRSLPHTPQKKDTYVFQVERHHHSNMSVSRFQKEYMATQTPVVITGLTDGWPSRAWSVDTLAKTCRNSPVDLQKRGLAVVEALPEDARKELNQDLLYVQNISLREFEQQLRRGMNFGEFAHYMKSVRGKTGGKIRDGKSFANFLLPYNMHDQCIREDYPDVRDFRGFCPELLDEVNIARYFQPLGAVQHLTCHEPPRLWVAPAGSRAYPAHLHTVPANIMSVMIQGHKRWTFWRYDVAPWLEPDMAGSATEDGDEVFWADPQASPKEDHHTSAKRYEVTVGPGDMLYVPCELVHHVYNEDETMALAFALIDERSTTCAANLQQAGSPRFKGRTSEMLRQIASLDRLVRQGPRQEVKLLEYPPQLEEDLSWHAFQQRYCSGDLQKEADRMYRKLQE